MVEKKVEVEGISKYKLVEIPTQTALAVQKPNGEVMSTEQSIVDILNKLDEILLKI